MFDIWDETVSWWELKRDAGFPAAPRSARLPLLSPPLRALRPGSPSPSPSLWTRTFRFLSCLCVVLPRVGVDPRSESRCHLRAARGAAGARGAGPSSSSSAGERAGSAGCSWSGSGSAHASEQQRENGPEPTRSSCWSESEPSVETDLRLLCTRNSTPADHGNEEEEEEEARACRHARGGWQRDAAALLSAEEG